MFFLSNQEYDVFEQISIQYTLLIFYTFFALEQHLPIPCLEKKCNCGSSFQKVLKDKKVVVVTISGKTIFIGHLICYNNFYLSERYLSKMLENTLMRNQ